MKQRLVKHAQRFLTGALLILSLPAHADSRFGNFLDEENCHDHSDKGSIGLTGPIANAMFDALAEAGLRDPKSGALVHCDEAGNFANHAKTATSHACTIGRLAASPEASKNLNLLAQDVFYSCGMDSFFDVWPGRSGVGTLTSYHSAWWLIIDCQDRGHCTLSADAD